LKLFHSQMCLGKLGKREVRVQRRQGKSGEGRLSRKRPELKGGFGDPRKTAFKKSGENVGNFGTFMRKKCESRCL